MHYEKLYAFPANLAVSFEKFGVYSVIWLWILVKQVLKYVHMSPSLFNTSKIQACGLNTQENIVSM